MTIQQVVLIISIANGCLVDAISSTNLASVGHNDHAVRSVPLDSERHKAPVAFDTKPHDAGPLALYSALRNASENTSINEVSSSDFHAACQNSVGCAHKDGQIFTPAQFPEAGPFGCYLHGGHWCRPGKNMVMPCGFCNGCMSQETGKCQQLSESPNLTPEDCAKEAGSWCGAAPDQLEHKARPELTVFVSFGSGLPSVFHADGKRAGKVCFAPRGLPPDCLESPPGTLIESRRLHGYCQKAPDQLRAVGKPEKGCQYVTLLQSPIQHTMSEYEHFCKRCSEGDFCKAPMTCPNMTLLEWAAQRNNIYTRTFGVEHNATWEQYKDRVHEWYPRVRPEGYTTSVTVKDEERAFETLTQPDMLVLFGNQWSRSAERLRSHLGDTRALELLEEEESASDPSELPEEDFVQLRSLLSHDIDLYTELLVHYASREVPSIA